MPFEVFELTPKGEQYSHSLEVRLDPRLRAILLQVDGKRTIEQLSSYAKKFGLGADDIWQLEKAGLIVERKLIPDPTPVAPWGDFTDSIMYDGVVEETGSADFYNTITDTSLIHHPGAQQNTAAKQPAPSPAKPEKMAGLSISEKLTDLAEAFFNKLPDHLKPHHTIKLHPRIFNRIELMHQHAKDTIDYLDKLLLLTEDTNRQGFSFNVVIELTNLKEHLEKHGKFF
ncbi:hypothetical protein [Parvibium lacunae]|uniref:Uncharacterized protein n=1 Tax=Parvibium lacunae TaxID=1888893 RepID=A0A368L5U1_9BURK|nr:hypothetical protein [Parvibium lacunae]RCS58510.1 hypothetical protein DU000_06795 [Parvibium lacunae]